MKNFLDLFTISNLLIRVSWISSIIILIFIINLNTTAQIQNKQNPPLLKVTIKDGKVTRAENVSQQNPGSGMNQGNVQSTKNLFNTTVVEEIGGSELTKNSKTYSPNKTLSGADLEIIEAYVVSPRSPNISFNVRFKNKGTETVLANYSAMDAFLSTDAILDESDYSIWRLLIDADLVPGSVYHFVTDMQANVSGYPDGNYFLIFKIDGTNAIAETDETNNVGVAWNSQLQLGAINQDYDFETTNITVTQVNNPIDFSYTIRNNGTYAADVLSNVFNGVYLSTDGRITNSDIMLIEYNDPVPSFGSEYTRTVTGLNISGVPDNTYYLGVIADNESYIIETNEINNVRNSFSSIAVNSTDLYLFNIWILDGEGPTISYSIEVLCTSSTGNIITDLKTFLSTDQIISADDYTLNTWHNATFIPGITNINTSNDFNVTGVPNGNYYLLAFVDPDNTVNESMEWNNTRTSDNPNIIINSITDNFELSINSLAITDAVGPDVQCSFSCANMGSSGSIPANTFYTGIYLSEDLTLTTSDYLVYNYLNPFAIDPGSTWSSAPTFTITGVPDGNYYLGVILDYTNVVNDVNPANNSMMVSTPQIQVAGGTTDNFDLSVYDLEILDAVGPDIQYHFHIINNGSSGTIPGNSFYINEYLSDDLTITTSDYQINSSLNPFDITPGFSWNVSPTVTISGVPDGNYYLGVIVDPTNAVADVNRANNVISLSTPQIQLGGGTVDNFDLSLSAINIFDPIPPDINYDFTISNNGTVGTLTANSFWVGEFLSSDVYITADDFKIAEWLNPTDFTPGGGYYYNSIRPVGSIPDGQYYYGVILDLYNSIPETDEGNNSNYCSTSLIDITTGVDNAVLPDQFRLFQNYPNPFNPNTIIKYSIAEESDVTLKVFDMLGREVSTLVNERKQTGNYQVPLNAEGFPSGTYLYKINAGDFIQTKRMILIK